MKKNLITAIVATCLVFVFYYAGTMIGAIMTQNPFGSWVMFLCLLGCGGVCIYTFVLGIKGIKAKDNLGLAIATTAVSGIGMSVFTIFAFSFCIYSAPTLFFS